MTISAISPNFQGKRSNVEAFINMDEQKIRQLAYLKTAQKVDTKKDRKVTNALFYAAPIAAGIAVAALRGGKPEKIFSKQVNGVTARIARGFKEAGFWAAALGAVDMLGFAKNKVAEKSPEVRKFDKEHPVVSMLTMLAAGIGAIMLVNKGGAKLGKMKAPKFLQKFATKADKFFANNGVVKSVKGGLKKFSAKVPVALKDIGKTALNWAPTMLLFGGLFHSIGSASKENREFAKNYSQLKERQAQLAQARIRELSIQNDYLMQDADNAEEIEILNETK